MTGKDNCEATAEQLLPTTRVHSSLPELTSDGENYSWTVTVGALHGSGLWSTPTAYSQPRFRSPQAAVCFVRGSSYVHARNRQQLVGM